MRRFRTSKNGLVWMYAKKDRSMPTIKVHPKKVRAFKDAKSFYNWLAKRHDKDDEVWIKIHKLDSGLMSITPKEAIDVVLCWGWIDGLRKGFDEQSICSAIRRAKGRASGARSTSIMSRGTASRSLSARKT
jgi:uncharacterized protein YdeI (YjbR/CyaY-like superfamily)